jgi:hypothetical protein
MLTVRTVREMSDPQNSLLVRGFAGLAWPREIQHAAMLTGRTFRNVAEAAGEAD